MKYPVLTRDNVAHLAMLGRKERLAALKSLADERGEGDDFDESHVLALGNQLGKLAKKLGDSPKKGTAKAIRLEADASAIVHAALRKYDDAIKMDLDFWTFIAFAYFDRFIGWRYNLDDGPLSTGAVKNYGGGNRQENLMFRLWCRAELVYDSTHADPYYIAKRGSIDFWRSHILRPRYASVRNFTRRFVLFQYPDGLKSERLPIAGIRELAKRLTRLKSNMVFEILDEHEMEKLLERESAEVVA